MKMRKEYYPAIAIYALSAVLFVAAIVGYVLKMGFATPCLLCGVALHLFASARLTKIGRNLREDLDPAEQDDDSFDEDEYEYEDE